MTDDIKREFEQLGCRYLSGRAYEKPRTGRTREWGYNDFVMTAQGEIEINQWRQKVLNLITEAGEEDLQRALNAWVQEHYGWCDTDLKAMHEAIQLHASRIFDDPLWVDFIPFNERYRPEVLKDIEIVRYKSNRRNKCDAEGVATKALADSRTEALPCRELPKSKGPGLPASRTGTCQCTPGGVCW